VHINTITGGAKRLHGAEVALPFERLGRPVHKWHLLFWVCLAEFLGWPFCKQLDCPDSDCRANCLSLKFRAGSRAWLIMPYKTRARSPNCRSLRLLNVLAQCDDGRRYSPTAIDLIDSFVGGRWTALRCDWLIAFRRGGLR